MNDVEDHNFFLFIRLPETEKRIERGFTVDENFYYKICKKYMYLRPKSYQSEKFFLNFKKGKYGRQPIESSFGVLAREIATFLKLPNLEYYTGHTFRHTSATLLVDVGADIATLAQHEGRRKSNSDTETSIEKTLLSKKIVGVKKRSFNLIDSVSLHPTLKCINYSSTYNQLSSTTTLPAKPTVPIPMQMEFNNTLSDGFDTTDDEMNFSNLINFENNFSQKSQIYSDSENEVTFNLLYVKLKTYYSMVYNDFKKWHSSKKTTSLSEVVFLDYFNGLSQHLESFNLL